ncbi:hypothetical protein L208DRAFT_1181351, partial [Tricholoma matsutake]
LAWGLAATSGAHHKFHLDADGFGTHIKVISEGGCKWWVITTPKNPQALASTLLVTGSFGVDDVDVDNYGFEAVLLMPGMELNMRPGTLHAVFTPKSAICLGGHFYSIGTITHTVYFIIHTFVGSQTLTNTEHAANSRTLLCRLIIHIYNELV